MDFFSKFQVPIQWSGCITVIIWIISWKNIRLLKVVFSNMKPLKLQKKIGHINSNVIFITILTPMSTWLTLVGFIYFRRISTKFQHHFKICLLWFLHEKECSFYTNLFYCTEMRWLFISSTAIWVTGSDTGSVASRARTELTSSKHDWTRIWAI